MGFAFWPPTIEGNVKVVQAQASGQALTVVGDRFRSVLQHFLDGQPVGIAVKAQAGAFLHVKLFLLVDGAHQARLVALLVVEGPTFIIEKATCGNRLELVFRRGENHFFYVLRFIAQRSKKVKYVTVNIYTNSTLHLGEIWQMVHRLQTLTFHLETICGVAVAEQQELGV